MIHRMIIISIIFLLTITLQAFAAKDGLVLYLPFDGELKDASGNENKLELIGNDDWKTGKFGKALEFDGTTHIEVLDEKEGTFDGTSGLTIEVWVWQDTHHDNGIVVKLTQAGSAWPCSYNFETWSDQLLYFDVGPDAGAYATAGYPLSEWFHAVGVFDGNKGEDRVYVNGKLAKTNPRNEKVVPDGDLPVYIGCVTLSSYFFKGLLDDLAIYNRALSEAEINEDMKGIDMAVESAGKLSTTWAAIRLMGL